MTALRGIRVIDFGQYLAGPMAAMLLADHGADVIRVDPPGGPKWDTSGNAVWNRNKRSIVLDLKKAGDLNTALQLIASADVVVENFRPGVLDGFGLGPRDMLDLNPALVYASLPGFGASDPRAGTKAWEGVLAAATGAYRPNRDPNSTGLPVYTTIPYSSAFGAFLAATAIVAALYARTRGAPGQHIEVPLFDATFTAIGQRGMKVHGRAEAVVPDYTWRAKCSDARWVTYVSHNGRHEAFLRAIGAEKSLTTGVPSDVLASRYAQKFAERSSTEWEMLAAEIGTELVTCHSSEEWLRHPHALASGIVRNFSGELADPHLGPYCGPGINVRLSESPGSIRTPQPRHNQHRDQILEELRLRADGSAVPIQSDSGMPPEGSGPLDGIKVLDLAVILAGPTCGRTLAEFGADVIKIDDPRRNPVLLHNDVNRGKRSILLDLKTAEGMAVFWRMVDTADVIVQNYRKGAADRLGISWEEVRRRNPRIIYVSINAFGQDGPCADRPGHEQIAQAASGMQMRYGGEVPQMEPFAANDYGTGVMAAFGVILALRERERTGRGQHVDTALAYTATMLQSGLLQQYQGKQWDEPRGQHVLGTSLTNRMYEARDGWFFLAAGKVPLSVCLEILDVSPGPDLDARLEGRFLERDRAHWTHVLAHAGISAEPVVLDLHALMADPRVVARGLSLSREHAGLGVVTTTAPSIRMQRTPVRPGAPASKPGEDAAVILAECGLAGQLDRLVRQGVVRTDGVSSV